MFSFRDEDRPCSSDGSVRAKAFFSFFSFYYLLLFRHLLFRLIVRQIPRAERLHDAHPNGTRRNFLTVFIGERIYSFSDIEKYTFLCRGYERVFRCPRDFFYFSSNKIRDISFHR